MALVPGKRNLHAARALPVVRGHKFRVLAKGEGYVDGGNGGTAARIAERPVPSEEAWLSVEIAISRRAGGDFIARVSFDDEASWVECRASDPVSALDGAALIARERSDSRARKDRAP
jgi:hypothetical protein